MCPVSRGAFFGIRVPRLKNENHDAAAVRRCTFAFVMHGFAFGNHNQTLGARRGTVRSRRASRSGIAELGPRRPKPVRNAFIRPHRIGRTTHPSPARSPTHRGPAFTRWRSLNADERNPGLPIPHRAGGLTRHIYRLHQDRIKLQGKHDFFVARHASSSTITSDCEFDTCNNLMRTR